MCVYHLINVYINISIYILIHINILIHMHTFIPTPHFIHSPHRQSTSWPYPKRRRFLREDRRRACYKRRKGRRVALARGIDLQQLDRGRRRHNVELYLCRRRLCRKSLSSCHLRLNLLLQLGLCRALLCRLERRRERYDLSGRRSLCRKY